MWEQYCERIMKKNPKMADPSSVIRIGAAEFMRHIRLAYEAGRRESTDATNAAKDFGGVGNEGFPDFLRSLMSDHFGMHSRR